jgi:hypothetical protein
MESCSRVVSTRRQSFRIQRLPHFSQDKTGHLWRNIINPRGNLNIWVGRFDEENSSSILLPEPNILSICDLYGILSPHEVIQQICLPKKQIPLRFQVTDPLPIHPGAHFSHLPINLLQDFICSAITMKIWQPITHTNTNLATLSY